LHEHNICISASTCPAPPSSVSDLPLRSIVEYDL
jgi:hypothetical protein